MAIRWHAGWTRRALVRQAAASAAMLGAGLGTLSEALPVRASTKVTIVWAPWHDPVPYSSELVGLFRDAAEPFLRRNPSIEIQFSPICCDAAGFIAAALAGQGPDVTQQYQFGPIRNANLLVDLMPFIRESNVDLSIFSQGRLDYWRTSTGLYGLPSYTNVYGTVINLGLLDEMGLAYPDPEWTYEDAVKLWRAATRKGSKATVGGNLITEYGGNLPAEFYLRGFGAHMQVPGDHMRCGLGTKEAIACGEFWYGALLEGIATTYGGGDCFPDGLVHTPPTVVDTFGTCDMPAIAERLKGIKWDLWLMPKMPAGRFTTAGPDSYLMNANTKHPQEAWELLRWVTTEPYWQRWQMRTMLGGPVLNSLWPEYTHVLQQVAPPLRHKNLRVIGQASSEIALRSTFTYADPQADAIANKWGGLILQRKVSVSEGFSSAAREIDALEAASAAGATKLARQVAATEAALAHAASVSGTVMFPPPPEAGAGTPAKIASGALAVKGGIYTLTGTGGGVYGSGDGCTFAAMPWRVDRGSLTCRLVSIASLDGALPSGAKIGLMVRSDLSDKPAEIAFAVGVDRGLHINVAPLPAGASGDQRPGAGNGLVDAGTLLVPSAQKPANYLRRPIWLRLVRDVQRWIAYASWDGRAWTPAGTPVGIEAEAVWAGLFATPKGSGRVRAVFDHLSFTPAAAYQIGG